MTPQLLATQFQTPAASGAPVLPQLAPMIPSAAGLGCVGCPAGQAIQGVNFGADPALTKSSWPTWVKVLIGVSVLGLVVGGVSLFAIRSARSRMYF